MVNGWLNKQSLCDLWWEIKALAKKFTYLKEGTQNIFISTEKNYLMLNWARTLDHFTKQMKQAGYVICPKPIAGIITLLPAEIC
jgi:hypothetical protein